MTEQIKQQILKVRDTALTNMFDFAQVRCVAENMELPELVEFLKNNKEEYTQFILTGKS